MKREMTIVPRISALALFLVVASILSRGQDFSADVVYLAGNNAASNASSPETRRTPKLYVSKGDVRLETNGFTGTVLLVNREEHTAFALYPGKRSFQPLSSGPSEYFRVANVDNACPDWETASEQKVVCEKVGAETVDGREAVKYQNKAASEMAASTVWVDRALKFVIKWEGGGTVAELENIKEGPQAAELFSVPQDYKIATPQKSASKSFSRRPR
jgi:hypothetical protein